MIAILLVPVLASAQGPRLQLDSLSRLATLASEVTDIALDPAMLQMAGNFLGQNDPESAAVKQMISELKGVFIKSFEFDRDEAYSSADVQSVRKQLAGPWTRLMAAETKNPKSPTVPLELVEIYSYREGDRSTGLAILVAEPRELTVVNIVGPIDLSKLAALEGKFGIPNIPTK
jgi:hypothetical protein